MYRYYQTSIKTINGVVLPDNEPDNWLGYRYRDKYYLKSSERIDEEEMDGKSIRDCEVETTLLRDQYV